MPDLFTLKTAPMAEDDGSAWRYTEPCSKCGGVSKTQVRRLRVRPLEENRFVYGVDSCAVILVPELADELLDLDGSLSVRSVECEDPGIHDYPLEQLVAGASLNTVGATRNPECGCVIQIALPIILEQTAVDGDVFSLTENPAVLLFSARVVTILATAAPELGFSPCPWAGSAGSPHAARHGSRMRRRPPNNGVQRTKPR